MNIQEDEIIKKERKATADLYLKQAAEIRRLRKLLEMYLRYNDDYGLSGTDMRRMLDNIWIPRVRAELENKSPEA